MANQVARQYVVHMSALIQLAQMKIQLALVQKQLAFWTQLAYNFRHCTMLLITQVLYHAQMLEQ